MLSFIAPVNYDAGSAGLTSADFNGDGIPDLAGIQTDPSGGTAALSVLLGNGDGTFQPAVFTGGVMPSSSTLVAADCNGDGRADALVRVPDGNLAVMLSNGDGTFQSPLEVPGTSSRAFAVGDLNGDGRDDLVVSAGGSSSDFPGSVSVFVSNPDGTFGAPVTYAVGTDPGQALVLVADFNGDGRPDLAVLEGTSAASVRVLLGNGDGTFQVNAFTYSLGTAIASQLAAGDFNGDGFADLVATNTNANSISVLVNTGTWPSGAPHRSAHPRSLPRESDLTGDFFRLWPPAAPRKEAAVLDGMVPVAPAGFRAERGDEIRAFEPAAAVPPDSLRPRRPSTPRPGADGWAEPDRRLALVLDAVLAGLTEP